MNPEEEKAIQEEAEVWTLPGPVELTEEHMAIVERVKAETDSYGLEYTSFGLDMYLLTYRVKFKATPFDYYDWTLEQRRFLQAFSYYF